MFQDKFVLADGTAIKESIVGVSWSTSSNSDGDITPGSVCASTVEIELWVGSDGALSVTQGTVLTYYKIDTELETETKLGVFTCDKPEKTGANRYKVTAYDNVTLLDVDVSDWLNSLTFPISIQDFAASLANKCKLELANEPRLNNDYQIQKFTGSGVNARNLMKMVCSASGCFCNADANGKLFFGWYKKNKDVSISTSKSDGERYFYLLDATGRNLYDNVGRALITSKATEESTYEIPYFANQLTFSDFTVKVIDKVQVKQSNDDVGVIYPSDEKGTNALVIQGNQLLSATSDEALRPYVKNLYDSLNNITYVPCSNIQTPETLDIKVGDIVTVSDGKHQFETWITSVTHSGNRCTFESVGNANRNTTTAVNDTQYNVNRALTEIKVGIDGLSATVVKDNEVRSKFAMDASSVTIDTGSLTFNSNTIVINSTNFKLDASGNVKANGTFESGDEQSGGYACIKNGTLELKYNGDRNLYFNTTISGRGYADMHLCGPGGQDAIVLQARKDDGSGIFLFDKDENPKAFIIGNGNAYFGGGVSIDGDLTLPEDYNHVLYMRRSKFQPCNGQNALYCNWVRVNGADGKQYWALCGFGNYQGT